MASKACIVGQYQTKLEAIARHPGVQLTVIVPPFWKDERGVVPLEHAHVQGYELVVEQLALNGHFHLHYYPQLPQTIRQIRPDIVHIDEEPYNFATFHALRAAKREGARVLFFSWQNLHRTYPPPFSWFEKSVIAASDYAIAGSQDAEAVLRSKGYHKATRVLPQFGVDPTIFTPKTSASLADSPFTVGYVGRFVPEKGLDLLIYALAGLECHWKLCLVGDGPSRSHLQNLARQLGMQDRVQIHTWRPSAAMPEFFQSLDLFVLPSRSIPRWKEQFGRVLIEAMSCQVPVIGSTCGEIPNVIGDAGLVFPEGNLNELRELIRAVYMDRALRHDLGETGRSRVLANYTQDRIASETVQVYREILAV